MRGLTWITQSQKALRFHKVCGGEVFGRTHGTPFPSRCPQASERIPTTRGVTI
jgi:hypothetical protein